MTDRVEVFLWEKGARNCSMVGATFWLGLGVLEICRRGRGDGSFPDTCRDLVQEAQIHGSLKRALRDMLWKLFMFMKLREYS